MQNMTRKGMWVEVIFSSTEEADNGVHSDPTAGHVGRTQTFYRCQNVIYWPGIFKDVEKIVCTLY